MKNILKVLSLGILTPVIIFAVASMAVADEKKDDSFFEVKIEKKISGDQKTAKIIAVGKSGYHCNTKYPWKLTLKSGKDLPQKSVLKKGDAKIFTEKEVVFEVTTGNSEVEAEMKMSFCDHKGCKAEKRTYKF